MRQSRFAVLRVASFYRVLAGRLGTCGRVISGEVDRTTVEFDLYLQGEQGI